MLTIVDYSLLVLTTVDYYCLLMTSVDLCWLVLTTDDICWLLLIAADVKWLSWLLLFVSCCFKSLELRMRYIETTLSNYTEIDHSSLNPKGENNRHVKLMGTSRIRTQHRPHCLSSLDGCLGPFGHFEPFPHWLLLSTVDYCSAMLIIVD